MDYDEYKRRVGNDGLDKLKALFYSKRQGPKGRTFHLDVRHTAKSQIEKKGRGGSIDYLDRTGSYAGRKEELIITGGEDPVTMNALLNICADETKQDKAHILTTIVSELPLVLDEKGWIEIAEELALEFQAEGYPVHWAIHFEDKGPDKAPNPHVHLIAASRPLVDGEFAKEGRPWHPAQFRKIIEGKGSLMAYRMRAAETINKVLSKHGQEANWHGGGFEDVGITRHAKMRVPEAVFQGKKEATDPVVKKIIEYNERVDRINCGNGGLDDIIWINNFKGNYHQKKTAEREKAKQEKADKEADRKERLRVKAIKQLGMLEPNEVANELKTAKANGFAEAHERFTDNLLELDRTNKQLEISLKDRAREAQNLRKTVAEINKGQLSYLKDIHDRYEEELPDLETAEGQSKAWEFIRWHEDQIKQAKDSMNNKITELKQEVKARTPDSETALYAEIVSCYPAPYEVMEKIKVRHEQGWADIADGMKAFPEGFGEYYPKTWPKDDRIEKAIHRWLTDISKKPVKYEYSAPPSFEAKKEPEEVKTPPLALKSDPAPVKTLPNDIVSFKEELKVRTPANNEETLSWYEHLKGIRANLNSASRYEIEVADHLLAYFEKHFEKEGIQFTKFEQGPSRPSSSLQTKPKPPSRSM